jgi:hypothetical protein
MADIEEQPKQSMESSHKSWLILDFQGHEIKIPLKEDRRKLLKGSSRWLTPASAENGDVRVSGEVFAQPVEDVERYLLKKDGDWWALYAPDESTIPPLTDETELAKFFNALDRKISSPLLEPKIAVLLESPHEQEYDADFNPLGPARGPTGASFHRYFTSHVLPMLFRAGLTLDHRPGGYHIFLVNPVPYQASLRHLLNEGSEPLKNAVWKKLWTHCKDNFMDRLGEYAPKIILNGCTADAKALVAEAVKEHEKQHGKVQHYNVAHPSQWQLALPPFGKAL